jgi:hypothetical protein
MDIDCILRSFWHVGYDQFRCNDLNLSYSRIAAMYNSQFNTNIVNDGGVKVKNVTAFFAKYFEFGESFPVDNLASEYANKTFNGNMHAITKQTSNGKTRYHSVIIKEIRSGKIFIHDPSADGNEKNYNVNFSEASTKLYGNIFTLTGARACSSGGSGY